MQRASVSASWPDLAKSTSNDGLERLHGIILIGLPGRMSDS
jgi:hypothetical protein